MILAVAALAVLALALVLDHRRQQAALDFERRRVAELLRMLEARSAPAEFAAYIAPETEDVGEWVASPDGLIVERVGT